MIYTQRSTQEMNENRVILTEKSQFTSTTVDAPIAEEMLYMAFREELLESTTN